MKRIISLALAVIMLVAVAVTFCSCEKKKCITCGEEKFEMFMEEHEKFGVTVYTCKDCQKQIDEAADQVKDALGVDEK